MTDKEMPVELTDDQRALLPTEEDVAFFEQHGWWISPRLLSDEELDDARYGVERYYAGERDTELLLSTGTDWTEAHGNTMRQNDYVSLQVDQLRRLAHHPLVGATAARLARTAEVRLFHDQLIYKPPQAAPSDTVVGWHTDLAYWKTCSSRDMLTAWIPLQDVTPDMGPMLVLDGSHRWEGNDELERFHERDLDATAAHIRGAGSVPEPVPMALDAGQVSFHHCLTIHGSQPNAADRPRVALAVHMQDEANRYVARTDEAGHRRVHLNDMLCRTDADGNPDYADPDTFPVLWRERHV
jgi:ectoine hydroxylase-related dioxygenase (phytanoyl-CoA dioxygenase family)